MSAFTSPPQAAQVVYGKLYSEKMRVSLNYSQPLAPEPGRVYTKDDVRVRLQDNQLCFTTVLKKPQDALDCAWTSTRMITLPLPNSASDWSLMEYSITAPRPPAAQPLRDHEVAAAVQPSKRSRGRPRKRTLPLRDGGRYAAVAPSEDTIDQTLRSSSSTSTPRPQRTAAIAGTKRARPEESESGNSSDSEDDMPAAEPLSKRRRVEPTAGSPGPPGTPARAPLKPLGQIQAIYGVNASDGSVRVVFRDGTRITRTTRTWRAFYNASTGVMESKLREFLQNPDNADHAAALIKNVRGQHGPSAAIKLRDVLAVHDAEIVVEM